MSNDQRIVSINLDDISDHELSTEEEYEDNCQLSRDNRMSDSSDFEFKDYCDFPFDRSVRKCYNTSPKKKTKTKKRLKSTDVDHKPVKDNKIEKVFDICNTVENEIKFDLQSVDRLKQNDIKIHHKIGLKDIDNDIKNDDYIDSKSGINSKVELRVEIKNQVKCKMESTVPMASTSQSNPKIETEVRKSNEVLLNSIELNRTEDKSTDSRYRFLPKNSSLLKGKAETSGYQTLTATTSTATVKNWVYLCHNCDSCLNSRNEFNIHHQKYHSKDNCCVKGFKKLDKTQLTEQLINSKRKKIKRYSKRHHNSSPNLTPKPLTFGSKSDSRLKYKNIKNSKKCDKTETLTQTNKLNINGSVNNQNHILTGQSSCAISTVGQTQYRVAQRCIICSFTPLVNSLQSIEDHIKSEHNYHSDIDKYHAMIMVKIAHKP